MDIVLYAFNFVFLKRNKLDHFVTLTHVKISCHGFFLQSTIGHVIKGIFNNSHLQIE